MRVGRKWRWGILIVVVLGFFAFATHRNHNALREFKTKNAPICDAIRSVLDDSDLTAMARDSRLSSASKNLPAPLQSDRVIEVAIRDRNRRALAWIKSSNKLSERYWMNIRTRKGELNNGTASIEGTEFPVTRATFPETVEWLGAPRQIYVDVLLRDEPNL